MEPPHKLNDVFDGLDGRTTPLMASLAGPIGTNPEIADLRQRLSVQDQKHRDVVSEIQGILDELELLQSQYVANIRKEVEQDIAEKIDKLVQERVAECLKTHIPQGLQDEVARSKLLPMSPRNLPSALQGPSSPTPPHTIASPVHPPHPSSLAHSSISLGLASPPPTSSTPSISSVNRLDGGSRTFEPQAAEKADATEVPLEDLTKSTPTPSTSILMETKDQQQNDSTEFTGKKKKERKERRRKQEEERLQEAEALERQRLNERRLKLKQEEERMLMAKQEKALLLAQERLTEERERKEKEEGEEQELFSKLAEETLVTKKAKAEAISGLEPEEREKAELEAHKGDGKQDTTNNRRPPPLDLRAARYAPAFPDLAAAAAAAARFIADITTVSYPEGFHGPNPVLNQNVENGKFRYDREFLLQFMSVCRERPATLRPLDTIGLEPVDHTHAMSRGGSGYHRPSSVVPPSRQASVGLGFTPSALGKLGANDLFSTGNFVTMGAGSNLSNERYANSDHTGALGSSRPSTMQGTASQGGAGAPLQKRVRTKRGENRNENKVSGGSGGQGRGEFNNPQQVPWAVTGSGSGPPGPPPKVDDLSKISKTQPLTIGPSSVSPGKQDAEDRDKRDGISRINSGSNIVSTLSSQGAEGGNKDKVSAAGPGSDIACRIGE